MSGQISPKAGCKRKGFIYGQALSQGQAVGAVSRKLEVTEQTYYRWRKEFGGMQVEQARRLKELERENTQLKRLVAELSLDNSILKEAAKGNS